jgi:hypothetical protein
VNKKLAHQFHALKGYLELIKRGSDGEILCEETYWDVTEYKPKRDGKI